MVCQEAQIPSDSGGGTTDPGGGGGGTTDPGDGGGGGGGSEPPASQLVRVETRGAETFSQGAQLNYTVYNDSTINAVTVTLRLSENVSGGSRTIETTVPVNGNAMLNSQFAFNNQQPVDAALCVDVEGAEYT